VAPMPLGIVLLVAIPLPSGTAIRVSAKALIRSRTGTARVNSARDSSAQLTRGRWIYAIRVRCDLSLVTSGNRPGWTRRSGRPADGKPAQDCTTVSLDTAPVTVIGPTLIR
jgi:hypothetical protein